LVRGLIIGGTAFERMNRKGVSCDEYEETLSEFGGFSVGNILDGDGDDF
jgi:hypothetical protein